MVVAGRIDVQTAADVLRTRLGEPAPARVQLLTGPRQVGKTSLLLRLQSEWGARAIYAAMDGPEASLPGFWERLWSRVEAEARSATAVLLLDEIHHVDRWAERLKGEWDRLRRKHLPVHVVATGSSALRLGTGSRESLAGRFERLTVAHWSAAAIAAAFEVPEPEAARLAVTRGTYPGAMTYLGEPERWSAYVRDAIVEPATGRDVLATTNVRRPALLRQVFAVAAASPAQVLSLQKLQGQLQDRGALETIAHYLTLLEEAFLVAAVPKFTARASRSRAAPPKLIALNNALCAVVDPRGIPDPERDAARFGAWVENACLAFAWNQGQRVTYWREEPLEVDAVLEGSWGSWVLEIKTGRFGAADLRGLLEFARRHPSHQPLVLCDADHVAIAERLDVPAMSWQEFLLRGLSRGGP
jgi:uncharacterized protein